MVQDRRPARWPILLAVLALTYLVALVFMPILGFELLDYDVTESVVDNPHIRGLTGENLKHIFTSRCVASYYPVRTLTYAVDYSIWGLNPTGFKLTNGLIHWANVMLVFWLILRLFPGPSGSEGKCRVWWDVGAAALSAGIFAIHPVVVEPVAWVAGREELLMTLGALGCFHFHLSARRLAEEGGTTSALLIRHALATLCCLFACLSNAVGAVVPLLVTAWDVLTLKRPRLRRIFYGTFLLWVIGAATIVIKKSAVDDVAAARPLPLLPAQQLMLVPKVYWLNLKSLAWPAQLALDYGNVPPKSLLEPDVALGGMAIGLTCLLLWKLRRNKLALFGLAWFGLALGPSSQLLPHHVHRADRFLYLPLVGLALAAALGISLLGQMLRTRAAVLGAVASGALVLFLLEVRSSDQVQTWRNSVTVWENCVEVNPDDAFAHDLLARNLAERGESERVEEHARKSLELDFAGNHAALCNRALALALLPNPPLADCEEAVRLAKRACELTRRKDPECLHTLAVVYCSLANAQVAEEQFAPALESYRKAIQADGRYDTALFNLAILLTTCKDHRLRNPEEAVKLAEQGWKALKEPDRHKLGILSQVYVAAGRLEMAVAAAEKAARMAQAAGDLKTADNIRRWIKKQQERPAGQPNVVDGESEATPSPDPSALGPGDE